MGDEESFYAAPQAELGSEQVGHGEPGPVEYAPRTFGETLSTLLKLYQDCFAPLFGVALAYGFIAGFSDYLVEISIDYLMWGSDATMLWGLILGGAIFIPMLSFVYFWIVGVKRVENIYRGLPTGDEFSVGIEKFLPVAGVYILMMLIVSGGLILCLIPGFIALYLLFVSDVAVIVEDKSPIDAIKRSWSLTRSIDNWFYVFGLVVLVGIMVMFPAMIVGGIVGFVTMANPIATNIVGGVISVVTFPLFVAMNYLLFQGLLARNQHQSTGYDEFDVSADGQSSDNATYGDPRFDDDQPRPW